MMTRGQSPSRSGGPRFDTATGRRITGYDTQTGEPILQGPDGDAPGGGSSQWLMGLDETWRGLSNQAQALVIAATGALGLALVAAMIVGATSGGGNNSQLSGVVHGDMVGAGNIGTGSALSWSHVYCGWKGGDVMVHANLNDGLPADSVQPVSEDVTISPIYTIRWSDGSEHRHGDGIGSILDVNVPAGKTVSWWAMPASLRGSSRARRLVAVYPRLWT